LIICAAFSTFALSESFTYNGPLLNDLEDGSAMYRRNIDLNVGRPERSADELGRFILEIDELASVPAKYDPELC